MSVFAAMSVGAALSAGVVGLMVGAAASMLRPASPAAKGPGVAYEPEFPWCDFIDPSERAVGTVETVRMPTATVRFA